MEAYNPHVEVVEYRVLRHVIRQTPLDGLVFITWSGGQREFVAGADRESVLARARAWIDENVSHQDKAKRPSERVPNA
jgi:hypothetical protein